jgi:hypothetical protein
MSNGNIPHAYALRYECRLCGETFDVYHSHMASDIAVQQVANWFVDAINTGNGAAPIAATHQCYGRDSHVIGYADLVDIVPME